MVLQFSRILSNGRIGRVVGMMMKRWSSGQVWLLFGDKTIMVFFIVCEGMQFAFTRESWWPPPFYCPWFSTAEVPVTSTSLLCRWPQVFSPIWKVWCLANHFEKYSRIAAQTNIWGANRIGKIPCKNINLVLLFSFFSHFLFPSAEDGNHISQQDTQAKLRRQYFWAGMTYDVMRHIMACCMGEPLSTVPVEHRSPIIQQRVNKFRKYYKEGVSVSLILCIVPWLQMTFSEHLWHKSFFLVFFMNWNMEHYLLLSVMEVMVWEWLIADLNLYSRNLSTWNCPANICLWDFVQCRWNPCNENFPSFQTSEL